MYDGPHCAGHGYGAKPLPLEALVLPIDFAPRGASASVHQASSGDPRQEQPRPAAHELAKKRIGPGLDFGAAMILDDLR